jgi:hypothetical protein
MVPAEDLETIEVGVYDFSLLPALTPSLALFCLAYLALSSLVLPFRA